MNILALDTSTKYLSLAVARDGRVLRYRNQKLHRPLSSSIMPAGASSVAGVAPAIIPTATSRAVSPWIADGGTVAVMIAPGYAGVASGVRPWLATEPEAWLRDMLSPAVPESMDRPVLVLPW